MTLNVIMRTSRANDLPSSSAWHICHAASDIQDRLSDGHVSDTVNFLFFTCMDVWGNVGVCGSHMAFLIISVTVFPTIWDDIFTKGINYKQLRRKKKGREKPQGVSEYRVWWSRWHDVGPCDPDLLLWNLLNHEDKQIQRSGICFVHEKLLTLLSDFIW